MADNKMHMQTNRNVVLTENPPFPKNMVLEVTNACNHQCYFCGNRHQRRKRVMADKKLFFSIIDQAIDLDVKEMGFYLGGEPFLNKDLEYYVGHAWRHGEGIPYIYVTSNGALATIDRVRACAENGMKSLKFSINGGTRDTYKRIHGCDDFETVKKNLTDISDAVKRGELKLATYITFVTCNWNKNEVEGFKREFGPLVDQLIVGEVNMQSGANVARDEMQIDEEHEVDHAKWHVRCCLTAFM